MPEFAYDGNTALLFVPGLDGISDYEAPTTTELNAAGVVDLSCMLARDGGFNPNITPSKVDGGSLCQMFTTTAHGTRSVELNATFLRDNIKADDKAWELFELGLEGVLVYRDGMPHDAPFANGQRVQVWPVVSDDPIPNPAASNQMANCSVGFAHPAEPVLKAVVGGGS